MKRGLKKKEAVFFAFVRNPDGENGEPALTIDPSQYVLRSVNGIGSNATVAAGVITFGFPISSILSIGDILYTIDPNSPGVPIVVGPVTAFSSDRTEVSFTLSAGNESASHLVYDGRKERTGRVPRCTRALLQVYRDQLIDYRYGTFRSRKPDDEIVSLILIIFD